MYKASILFLLITITACSKSEDEFYPDIAPGEVDLVAVKHAGYSVDSIFYINNVVTGIRKFRYVDSIPKPEISYRLTHSEELIKIFASQSGKPEAVNSIVLVNGLISEITAPENNLKATFHYDQGRLSYFLYKRYRNSLQKANNFVEATDSISVEYSKSGTNITGIHWYARSYTQRAYQLLYNTSFKFDTKRNPYYNSWYFLALNWKGPDDVIGFFNQNNILSIGSFPMSYNYDENEYPVCLDISTYGRTTFYYRAK